MDIYIVIDESRVVGASARLQGAELIRAKAAVESADSGARVRAGLPPSVIPDRESEAWRAGHRVAYDRLRIENNELQDMDD